MFPKTQGIVNPESNKGRTGKRWKKIKEALQAFLKEFKCEFTEKPYQAAEISRAAIKEGSDHRCRRRRHHARNRERILREQRAH